MTDGKLGRILRWIQPIFVLIAAGFIFYLLKTYWPELRAHPWQLNWGWFGAACLLLLVVWWMEIYIWRSLLGAFQGRLGIVDTLRIWFISGVIRYIPGNVWQPLSMTLFCYRRGIRAESTLASIVLFQIVTLLGTLPITALYINFTPSTQRPAFLDFLSGGYWAAAALAPLLIFVFNPMWLMHILNWLLRKARRGEIPGVLTRSHLAHLFLVAVLSWLVWGATFAALTFSLGEYSWADVRRLAPSLVVVYPIAYAVGFVSLLTPSGFGVREGALLVLLAPYLALHVVTIIALAMRLLAMVFELILAGIAVLGSGRADVYEPQPDGVPVRQFPALDSTPDAGLTREGR